ncbi:restriction endonuclease subunit S [Glaesserella parasuis]|uniref:restriction endonuclease subunit S n=1 Tax=Glaesserella parasuis TaxID=738 RepID=UPI00243659A4|nr:restriction endonuclease subunit S [Glaesserella parasuis]MDG6328692.1 restriction endonuclease subunit S [Glaesserella parasuis]MDO9742962.1 restriction endonuclease subunit S [Glaesserella parasuis]MDO9755942.1 restriction endonuclease subunit S [Glaesserella parasuis]MDO9784838.1 restriction endonuclease subunit S [Glaesserella parasuis]MDO9868979.1 restriction endonuclease subunit S [Glaesserella parasuis]
MSILEKYSLKEICDFQNGFAFKNEDYIEKNDDALEVFRMGYINKGGGYKDDSSPVFIPKSYPKNLEKYLLLEGDIAMAMTDMKNSMAILGYSARIPTSNRFVLNQRVGRIRVIKKDLVDEKYLYYFMNSKEYILSLQSKSNSGVQVNLGTNAIKDSIIFLPSLQRQKYVSDILYTLDEKIALNTQINQTLEQIAQTIFKSWFIDFDPVHAKANALASGQAAEQATQAAMSVISGKNTQELHRLQTANPEQYQQLWEIAEAFPSGVDEEGVPRGWEQTTLSEVCSMKNGYAFKSSDWTEEGIPVIKIGSVKPMIVEVDGNGFVDEEHSVLHSEFLLTEGDIVVGLTGYVGEVGRIPQGRTAMLNQRVAKFIPNKLNEQQDYYSFVYCLVRDKSFKAFAETNAKGSAQANISTKELLNYSIILASSEIQMKFESLIKPLLDKILVNSGNNENLSKVRDLLLPKLLSGEV